MASTSPWKYLWELDPDIDFLNHGSFGACPRSVLAAQSRWRARLERQPVQFFVRDLEAELDRVRARVAEFVRCEPGALVFVPNATTGVNTVLQGLDLQPGATLLVTDHGYGACRNAAERTAARAGARVVVVDVPFPLTGPEVVVERVLAAARPRPRPRLALLDHVTSPTGLVFPIEQLVRELDALGVETLVDGAHAPGMVPVDLGRLGAAYYAANGHKWLCAPKGAAFLYVRGDLQSRLQPLVTSHGATVKRDDRRRFLLEFDWTGTDDPTAVLCLPEALSLFAGLVPGGWEEIHRRNHELVVTGRRALCTALGVPAPCPEAMLGSMAAVPLPDAAAPGALLLGDPLQIELWERHRIEVPIWPWPASPRRLVRISSQLYNDAAQYERLGAALAALLGRSG